MEKSFIYSHVDHTLLKAAATWEEIKKLSEEGMKYHMASVCVPSSFVKRIRENFPSLPITTVVGFPLGNCSTEAKVAESLKAIEDGADEIDMVIHIGALKEGNLSYVEEDIRKVKEAVGRHILKVIVETCFLTEEEKIKACEIVTRSGADFIKTSTGFGTKGATVEDIALFKKHIGPNVRMKAAGGIHTKEEMETYLEMGVERIGASGAIKALEK